MIATAPATSAQPGTLHVPPALERALLRDDAALYISISGGKDSQAMLAALASAHRTHGWRCDVYAIHADLGRVEWKESLPHCQKTCDALGIPLIVVRRPQGDLLQEVQDRMAKLQGERNHWMTPTQRYCTADQKQDQIDKAKRQDKPHWPSADSRYCTADQKRGPIDKAMRAGVHWPSPDSRYCTAHQKTNQINTETRKGGYSLVISAMGMRAGESTARSKKNPFAVRAEISTKEYKRKVEVTDKKGVTKTKVVGLGPEAAMDTWEANGGTGRLALDWMPIFTWDLEQVWLACGTTGADLDRRQKLYKLGFEKEALDGWPAHPAYVYGNQRVSCSLCILATAGDLDNGARHNPELFREYVRMEDVSGFTFQHGRSLRSLPSAAAILGETA